MAADAKSILKRQEQLESFRASVAGEAQAIRDFIMPLVTAPQASESPGTRTHTRIWDNSAELDLEVFVSGVYSLNTRPGLQWFRFSTGDDELDRDYECAAWLEHASRTVMNVLNASDSGFYTSQQEMIADVGGFGNGTKFIDPDRRGRIRFDARPWGEIFIAEGDDGRIDTWHRKFPFTARQAAMKWGKDRVGSKIAQAAEREPDKPFEFLQAVYPRTDEDRRERENLASSSGDNVVRLRPPRERMAFADCIVALEEKILVTEGGYDEAPFVTPRWFKRNTGPYGLGPGHRALHDVRALQFSVKTTMRGAAKLVDPPLMIPDDGVGTLDMNPNAVNVYRAGTYSGLDPIKAIDLKGRPDIGEEMNNGIRARIQRAFYVPQFQNLNLLEPRITATAVMEWRAQTRQLLGPMLGRQQTEDLEPTLGRTLALVFRLGYLRPMPERLRRMSQFRVRFLSEAVQDQRLIEAAGILRRREATTAYAAASGDTAIWDNFDADLEDRHLASVYGEPMHFVRDPRTVAQMRQARREEQQQMAQAAEAAGAAQLAATTAKATKDFAAAQPERRMAA